MKIVFLDESTVTIGDIDFSRLKSLGHYEGFANSNEQQTMQRAKEADVIITNKALITAAVLNALPLLKLVTVVATGYNIIDLEAAKEKGVCVCNVPGYATKSVAQHTFTLILNLATKAYVYHNDIQAGQWQKSRSFTLLTYPTFDLAGKTIGIIGFGAIGREVAKIAESFGMNVLAYDAFGIKDDKYANTDFETLLRQSDVVTLHCPLTEQNRHLMDAAALAKMKKTAVLINTARGPLIDEEALTEALNSATIAGAGIDVLTVEPPREANMLLKARNLIVTPHCAWSTQEARQRLINQTTENIRAFFSGRPRNMVTQ
jgi:glycerate dehydrogenase